MSLATRTDSDRLDELLEAVEKQTHALNRVAMTIQEESHKTRRTKGALLWWVAGVVALLSWIAVGIGIVIGGMSTVWIGAITAFVLISYVLARCEEKIRGAA